MKIVKEFLRIMRFVNGESHIKELKRITEELDKTEIDSLDLSDSYLGKLSALNNQLEQAEHDAELAGHKFRLAFFESGIGMAIVGLAGHWLEVNKRLCELVGYTESELTNGMRWQDITHPDDISPDTELVGQLVAGKIRHYELHKRYIHKNGSVIPIILNVSLVKDEGESLYFISQIRPVEECPTEVVSSG